MKVLLYSLLVLLLTFSWASASDDETDRIKTIFCGIFPTLCSPQTSSVPSTVPSSQPTTTTGSPSHSPTLDLTSKPSETPTNLPSFEESTLPTLIPSSEHSGNPSSETSSLPSVSPTRPESLSPLPSSSPSLSPIPTQTQKPSNVPSRDPSSEPSLSQTQLPSSLQSSNPSSTNTPSASPTVSPTVSPSSSLSPTQGTSFEPTALSSQNPTASPTIHPSVESSSTPSTSPTLSSAPSEEPTFGPRPNLVVIMTDQHNLRTLGCYREYFKAINQTEQGTVWGPDNIVETPHLDRLAAEGVLFTNFHTTTPLCTPNRASFVSGLYPAFTGADRNHNAMHESVVTFAEVLKEQEGYDTSYYGKWHLNGANSPGWGNETDYYDFGFNHIKYLFNQGHWKWIEELPNGKMKEYDYDGGKNKFRGKEEHFTTDFLFDRGIEHMERNRLQGKPFLSFLSIPDPHAPKFVRPPYDTMYDHMTFQLPYTARTAALKSPSSPLYNYYDHQNVPLDEVEEYLQEYENREFYQNSLRQYFGMVKCIDDNIGKLLSYLDNAGIAEDTIVAFTSDHGDMLAEHGKFNKNRPYRTSAGIPMILRYPEKVMAGKVVETAYTSVDFAPSVLKLMGVTNHGVEFQGIDFSEEVVSDEMVSSKDVIRYVFDSGVKMRWAAAVMQQYRLVISAIDVPWLFDLNRDPYEIQNFYNYQQIVPKEIQQQLQDALFTAMPKYQIPLYLTDKVIYWTKPACIDSNDRLPTDAVNGVCDDLGVTVPMLDRCSKEKFMRHCPITCGTCCADSAGEILRLGDLTSCDAVENQNYCRFKKIAGFCPSSCDQCEAVEI